MASPTPDSETSELNEVLMEFEDVFKEPSELSPHRDHDHQIVLKEGTAPVNVTPYRYPVFQKNEIEKLIQEMLQSGVIRHSTNPFSSPVVLVKKKDGTWRMCIDYRELNLAALKDKFLIPIVEELIDELFGSHFSLNWTLDQATIKSGCVLLILPRLHSELMKGIMSL